MTFLTSPDPAYLMLLANALKPQKGESLARLRTRAAATAATVSRGEEALAKLESQDATRVALYRACDWRLGRLALHELRPWPGMDELPLSWCEGSIDETAALVRAHGLPPAQSRLKRLLALRGQVETQELVAWLCYLPLPVLPDELLHARPSLEGSPWGLDDGCARAVALSLLGVEFVDVLMGCPKS